MEMDKEQSHYQNHQSDNPDYHTEFYLYQQAQQWQQERLEFKQDLTLICQYLRSLAERQEQLWFQIHFNHEQVLHECRQNFQILSSLIDNRVEPKANSQHMIHMKEGQLNQEITGTSLRDGSMPDYMKLPRQHPENLQDNAKEQEADSIGLQNKLSNRECNAISNVPGGEQSREMPESNRNELDLRYYQQQGLADPVLDWTMEHPNAWHMNGQIEISEISDRQKDKQKEVHKSDVQLSKEQNELHNMEPKYKNNISETHDDILETLHPLQNLSAGLESEHREKAKYLHNQNDKPWHENEQKGRSQTFNEQDKHLENTKGPKEQMRSQDPNLSHKMYTDAVMAGRTSSSKVKINPSSEENVIDKPTSQFDTTDLPESKDSFLGTGFYADAISKLLTNRTPSPVGSVQSNVSSNDRTFYRSARKDSSKSETINSKTFSTPPKAKENIEKLQKNVPVEYMSESGTELKIVRSREFSVSNKFFLAPYMYTRSKPCKARVRICFNKAGYLNAFIHIAQGAFDDDHEWPIRLSGNGLILHNGSKRFVPIWHLQSSTCHKPSPEREEVILKTVVCLSSSRNDFTDITYKDLEKMQFAGNNCLTFKWNLKVEKR